MKMFKPKFIARRKLYHAFTLIELLVIVAITALLAMATLPTYQMNTTQARIASVIPLLDKLMHDVLIGYASTGSTPNSLDGVIGSGGGGYGDFVNPDMTTNLHYQNGSGAGWTNKGALIAVNVPPAVGEGIPGYVESTNGNDGMYNSVAMAFYDEGGTIVMYCGRWDSSSTLYIPPNYLPPGCNNDNFITIVTGN